MKLSISNIAWDNSENKEVYKLLFKYGFSAIEVAPTKIWDNLEIVKKEDVLNFKKFWNSKGIKLVAFQSLLYGKKEFNIFDLSMHDKILSYLEKVLWIGNIFEINAVVFGSPKNRLKGKLPYHIAEKLAFEFFLAFAELGKKYGIKIALEPNPKEYGADFLLNTDETLGFIKKINHPFLRLNLDTGILFINKENIEKSIEIAFPYLVHFHISEPYLNLVDENSFIPHKKIAQQLKRLKYSGYYSIEMRALNNKNLENIEKALSFVASIYGEK
ncbi:MAG: hypothetical protein KatS3mg093_387 [Candidatus Parcubacteria bacterium]|nr:MAG: hypothetical protein KatS3mg093_387 [Candidatus Parcubacteria bacterium]